MKYSPQLYAEAFLSVLYSAPDKNKKDLLERFLKVLKKHGDIKYAHRIIELIQKELTVKGGGKVIKLEFARTPSDKTLKTVSGFLSKKDFVKIVINPSLGAGVRVTANEEKELDYSLEHKLKQMFKYV